MVKTKNANFSLISKEKKIVRGDPYAIFLSLFVQFCLNSKLLSKCRTQIKKRLAFTIGGLNPAEITLSLSDE